MKHYYNLPIILLITLISASAMHAQMAANDELLDRARATMAKESAAFIENRGQWNARARYLAQLDGLDLWVMDDGVLYDLHSTSGGNVDPKGVGTYPSRPSNGSRAGHIVRMRFEGAGDDARAMASKPLPGTISYFKGNDPDHWVGSVQRYRSSRIRSLYPGIDALLYFDHGLPRYDILLAPGADPTQIRISYDGAQHVSVNKHGELSIATSIGELTQKGLFAYQQIDGARRQVPCSFRIDADGSVGFQLGHYDPSLPLVIDPILFGTFISPTAYSRSLAIAVDARKNVYITGYTGLPAFPTSVGAYQRTFKGAIFDSFVTKLDSNGASLLYSTFIGGTADDIATSIAVEGNSIYLAGYTFSNDFPTVNAYQATYAEDADIFVVKLDPLAPQPQDQLVYATYVGGAENDYAYALAVGNGIANVTGLTNSTDFPTVNAFQPALSQADAIVFRLSAAGSSLIGSTYLGGGFGEMGFGIAVDQASNVYVCGYTGSNNFPTADPIAAAMAGNQDAFVTKLTPNLSSLVYSTYLGGAQQDIAYGIAVDNAGFAYVTGKTASADFPTTTGSYRPTRNGLIDAFVAKLSNTGNTLSYSSYFGGNGDEWALDIALDTDGNAYFTGITRSDNFPYTGNAIQKTKVGSHYDAFVASISASGSQLSYATYLGGAAGDTARSIAVDADGYIYVTGTTFSQDFPTTPGTYRSSGDGGAYVVKLGIMRITEPQEGEVWCAGEYVDLAWFGGSNAAGYDLQITADSGKTYTPIAFNLVGGSYNWFIPASLQAGTGYRIRVIASNGDEADMSPSFTINTPPTITSHPASTAAGAGTTATFAASATASPAATVRWEVNDGSGWKTIDNQTGTTLKVNNVQPSQNGYRYRAVFSNECKTVATDSAVLTVASVMVDYPNGGETLCAGRTVTLRWTIPAGTGSVTLLISNNSGSTYTPIANNVSGNTYEWTIPEDMVGAKFRLQTQLSGNPAQDISDGDFTINKGAAITKDPVNTLVADGDPATFTVTSYGIPDPTVRWEMDSGSGWIPVPDAAKPTLIIPNALIAQTGTKYRAIASNECGDDTSAAATLRVEFEVGGVDDEKGPEALRLTIAPNPVRNEAELRYRLPRAGRAELRIVDAEGRIVLRPAAAQRSAGEHAITIRIDALPAGTYTCVLRVGDEQRAVRMVVVR